jgi:tetrahydromethanopterin S-methyltransferase subunit G
MSLREYYIFYGVVIGAIACMALFIILGFIWEGYP